MRWKRSVLGISILIRSRTICAMKLSSLDRRPATVGFTSFSFSSHRQFSPSTIFIIHIASCTNHRAYNKTHNVASRLESVPTGTFYHIVSYLGYFDAATTKITLKRTAFGSDRYIGRASLDRVCIARQWPANPSCVETWVEENMEKHSDA